MLSFYCFQRLAFNIDVKSSNYLPYIQSPAIVCCCFHTHVNGVECTVVYSSWKDSDLYSSYFMVCGVLKGLQKPTSIACICLILSYLTCIRIKTVFEFHCFLTKLMYCIHSTVLYVSTALYYIPEAVLFWLTNWNEDALYFLKM